MTSSSEAQVRFRAAGTLTFGGGSIDANSIEMGIQVPGPFIGGSVGNAILNVNNDPGVGPALLTVRSNLVMAVQQPGNTDANGSTAVITVNNGSTLAVAGDIVDASWRSRVFVLEAMAPNQKEGCTPPRASG